MTRVVNNLEAFKTQILNDLLDANAEFIEKVAFPQIKADQENNYNRTTKYWGEFQEDETGNLKYRRPKPKVELKLISRNIKTGLKYAIVSQMIGSFDEPSKLWYWLDKGNNSYTQEHTSPLISRPAPHQTEPYSLDMKPLRGTLKPFIIHAGQHVRATPARNWSIIIATLSEDRIKTVIGSNVYPTFKVTKTAIRT